MLNIEIQDTVEFEVALTKILLLNRSWAHKYTSMIIVSGKSNATIKGVIKLTDKYLISENRKELTNDIRHQIAHLISGIRHEHNFNWQYIANKLNVKSDLIKIKAKELVECKYCDILTVLVKSGMCHQCKHIYDAILLDETIVFKILHDIGAL